MHARSLAVAGLLTVSLAFPACSDEPDKAVLKAGERQFVKCRSCHSIDKAQRLLGYAPRSAVVHRDQLVIL